MSSRKQTIFHVVMAHAFNFGTSGVGDYLRWRSGWSTDQVPGQQGIHREIISQNKKNEQQQKMFAQM